MEIPVPRRKRKNKTPVLIGEPASAKTARSSRGWRQLIAKRAQCPAALKGSHQAVPLSPPRHCPAVSAGTKYPRPVRGAPQGPSSTKIAQTRTVNSCGFHRPSCTYGSCIGFRVRPQGAVENASNNVSIRRWQRRRACSCVGRVDAGNELPASYIEKDGVLRSAASRR